jgi:hypothetical protein
MGNSSYGRADLGVSAMVNPMNAGNRSRGRDTLGTPEKPTRQHTAAAMLTKVSKDSPKLRIHPDT